ncbi:alpha/beta hydrolase [Yinghuangia soli]|uniref:Alpha/beta hydrolase n=1 Tax=Yinghuangia soli TaxID=2908204 RepID=A0AA41Q4T2_9ACTN|nr:alpha/beta hydrolase [Yinghuangia soli]MCF2531559.1 alpha/beta hydrolase [Yinghuangia soli]
MTTYVLVHGAFRGGWSWIRVRRLLEAGGHQVWTPSLTGAGDRYRPDVRARIHLADWAEDIARLLHYNDLADVVLVGHSQGGAVAEAAAGLAPARIRSLRFVDAAVPAPGRSIIDSMPPETASAHGPPPPPDAWLPPVPPPAGQGLDAETAAWIAARLTPSPAGPAYDRLEPLSPSALAIPRDYAFCTGTPPSYPCTSTRLRLEAEHVPYIWIKADHDAPLTAPVPLAAWLTRPCPP